MKKEEIDNCLRRAEDFAKPILLKYYEEGGEALKLLMIHSRCVARKALECAVSKSLDLDYDFVAEAALLHDIGVVKCDAPSIHCFGSSPYIRHGIEGRDMLLKENLPRHAMVCAHHTGAGLTADDILSGNLPLPVADYLPSTPEERLICYADKFYSKSATPDKEKPAERVRRSIGKYGEASLMRFEELEKEFG